MIQYTKGDLFDSKADALVNTVNTVGVMGKGIALQFREAFPENYHVYRNACRNNEFHVGELLIVEDSNLLLGRKLIVNFPTKMHWKMPSEYSYIEQGLVALRREIIKRDIRSIAIPPLGSNNGGLDWLKVKSLIEKHLADLDCDIILYEPSKIILERMKSERVKLTPARAMMLLMFDDMNLYGEFLSVFATEQLIYFMQRFGARSYFRIDFKPYYYGPYSNGKVTHLLYHMNGSYIKGMGGMENHPFDYIWLIDGAVQEAKYFIDNCNDSNIREICNKTKLFLRGYYFNYSLELLSSVDYLLENIATLKYWRNENEIKVLDILEKEMHLWSKSKGLMFDRTLLAKALAHLRTYL